jgi:CheY-like chemotaxis protein
MNTPESSESTPKKKILIVEDNESVRGVLAEALTRAGYHILAVKDGQEGLANVETFAPDLIATDIEMPNMNGIEMSRILRGCQYTKPILVMSASIGKAATAQEVAAITPYMLHKPVMPSTLRAKLAEIFGQAA